MAGANQIEELPRRERDATRRNRRTLRPGGAFPLGTFGNVPRTLCCNPPINNWDVGVFKKTPVGEKMHLEFRTEIFNIFNHAQFYGTDGNSGNQGSTFGQPQKVRDPRLFQFALKLVF